MSAITLELERTLASLDPASAEAVRRLVGDVLALVKAQTSATSDAVDANGWPEGYFETYAGCLADDKNWEPPADPPPTPPEEL